MDLLDKSTSTGQVRVKLLDTKVSGSNTQRWVTAFMGDSEGINPLPGCKVVIERSTDFNPASPGSATWDSYFTGRITNDGLESKLYIGFDLRDGGEDLKEKVFVDAPHSSITYAQFAPLCPLSVGEDYGPFTGLGGLKATIKKDTTGNICQTRPMYYLQLDEEYMRATFGPNANLIVKAYPNMMEGSLPHLDIDGRLRIHIEFLTGARTGQSGELVFDCQWEGHLAITKDSNGHWHLGPRIYFENLEWTPVLGVLPGTIADAIVITDSDLDETVEFYVYQRFKEEVEGSWSMLIDGYNPRMKWTRGVGNVEVSDERPMLIGDVHPVQFWKDILDGKFSLLDTATGNVLWSFGYSSSAFSTLIADTTFGTGRWRITDADRANNFAEEQICQVWQLGYYYNEDNEIVPVDLRRSRIKADAGSAPTIGQADVEADYTPSAMQDGSSAITRLEVRFYKESLAALDDDALSNEVAYPDIPPGRIKEEDEPVIIEVGRTIDLGLKTHKIDATGLRAEKREDEGDQARFDRLRDKIYQLTETIRNTHGAGPTTYRLRCRRTSNTNGCYPGSLRKLDVDVLPDPATVARGGTRLGICLERQDPAFSPWLELTFMDLGRASVATAPSFGTITKDSDDPRHTVNVPLTANAADDRVELWVAVTPTSTGTRPTDSSSLWRVHSSFTMTNTSPQTIDVAELGAGMRCWFRARTLANDDNDYLIPSDYVYPSSPSYIDLDALPTPNTPTVGTISGKRAIATWTNSDSNLQIEVFVQQGSCPGTPGASNRVALLEAGTTSYEILGLALSTGYCFSYRYWDGISAGPIANDGFTTTGTALVAPDAGWCHFMSRFIQPPSSETGIVPNGHKLEVTNIVLGALVGSPKFRIELQRAPDSGGSPGTWATLKYYDPGPRHLLDKRPNDGLDWWYRYRLVSLGYDPGAWSNSAVAPGDDLDIGWLTDLPPLPGYPKPTLTVDAKQGDPHTAVVRVRLWPEHDDNYIHYADLAAATTIPNREDSGSWTSVNANELEVEVTRDSSLSRKFVAWASVNNIATAPNSVVMVDPDRRPEVLNVDPNVDSVGQVWANIKCDADSGSVKVAVSTSAKPSKATIQGATPVSLTNGEVTTGVLTTLTPGQTAYIGVLAYSQTAGGGAESEAAYAEIQYSSSQYENEDGVEFFAVWPKPTSLAVSNWFISVRLGSNMASYKWAYSTSSFPAAGTGTCRNTAEEQFDTSLEAQWGDIYYFTLTPYTGASCAGTQGIVKRYFLSNFWGPMLTPETPDIDSLHPNPAFELDVDAATVSKFWVLDAPSAQIVANASNAYDGNNYLELQATTGAAGRCYWGGIPQGSNDTGETYYMLVKAGQKLRFQSQLYRESGDGSGKVVIELRDKDKANPVTYDGNVISSSGAWAKSYTEVTVPSGYKYARMYIEGSVAPTSTTTWRVDQADAARTETATQRFYELQVDDGQVPAGIGGTMRSWGRALIRELQLHSGTALDELKDMLESKQGNLTLYADDTVYGDAQSAAFPLLFLGGYEVEQAAPTGHNDNSYTDPDGTNDGINTVSMGTTPTGNTTVAAASRVYNSLGTTNLPSRDNKYQVTVRIVHDGTNYSPQDPPLPDGDSWVTTITVEYRIHDGGSWGAWTDSDLAFVYSNVPDGTTASSVKTDWATIPGVGSNGFEIRFRTNTQWDLNGDIGGSLYTRVYWYPSGGSWPTNAYNIYWETGGTLVQRRGLKLIAEPAGTATAMQPHVTFDPTSLTTTPAAGDGAEGDVIYVGGSVNTLYCHDGTSWQDLMSGGGTAHNILSATHTDTTGGGSEATGDILYRNASSQWTRLAIGVATRVLKVSGTPALPTWGQVDWSELSGSQPAPISHASSHENGGGDEISVAGLSGLLADAQTPLQHSINSATYHSSFPLTVANGGTGRTTLDSGEVLRGAGTSAVVSVPQNELLICGKGATTPSVGAGMLYYDTTLKKLMRDTGGGFEDLPAVIAVRKNTGGTDVGTRRRLNLIEGTDITLTVSDDSGNDEIDITVAYSGSAGTHALGAGQTNVNASVDTAGDEEFLVYDTTLGWRNRDILISDLPTITIAYGGTNITSYASGDILYASATNVLAKLTKGSDGEVLVLASGLPTWGAAGSAGLPSNIAYVDAANVFTSDQKLDDCNLVLNAGTANYTIYASGSGLIIEYDTGGPGTQIWQIDSSGVLQDGEIPPARLNAAVPISKGGTNLTGYTQYDIIYASATNVLAKLGISGASSGDVLTWTGSGFAWQDPGTGATTLNELTDVTISGAAEGQALVRGASVWGNSQNPTWGGYHTWELDSDDTLGALISVDTGMLVPSGYYNSAWHEIRAYAYYSSAWHSYAWRQQVIAVDAAGSSTYTISTRVDSGSWNDVLTIDQGGYVSGLYCLEAMHATWAGIGSIVTASAGAGGDFYGMTYGSGASGLSLYRATGSQGTPGAVTSAAWLGYISFDGYASATNDWVLGARIRARAGQLWSDSGYGTILEFLTNANGETSGTGTVRAFIASDGGFVIGATDPGGTQALRVDGTARVDGALTLEHTNPTLYHYEDSGPTDEKIYKTETDGGEWRLKGVNDAYSATEIYIRVTRTGTTLGKIQLAEANGAVVIGTDPGGSEKLRCEAGARFFDTVYIDGGTGSKALAFKSTHTTAYNPIGEINAVWNSTVVGKIRFRGAADTVNQDEGDIIMQTAEPGGTLQNAIRLTQTQDLQCYGNIQKDGVLVIGPTTGTTNGAVIKFENDHMMQSLNTAWIHVKDHANSAYKSIAMNEVYLTIGRIQRGGLGELKLYDSGTGNAFNSINAQYTGTFELRKQGTMLCEWTSTTVWKFNKSCEVWLGAAYQADAGGLNLVRHPIWENSWPTGEATITKGYVVRLGYHATYGTVWYHCNATDLDTLTPQLIGIAMETKTSINSAIKVCVMGCFLYSSYAFGSSNAGDALYVPVSDGVPTTTAPSSAGQVVQVVGHVTGDTELFVAPQYIGENN